MLCNSAYTPKSLESSFRYSNAGIKGGVEKIIDSNMVKGVIV